MSCPKCNIRDGVLCWGMGGPSNLPEECNLDAHAGNRCNCYSCGHYWFPTCKACGYQRSTETGSFEPDSRTVLDLMNLLDKKDKKFIE